MLSTSADHIAEAERLIRSSGEFMIEGDADAADRCLATAQVHATLAAASSAGVKTLTSALLKLCAEWNRQAGALETRANQLGNSKGGHDAYADACKLRSCAEELAATITTATT
jgi:hypothetical protein